MPRYSGLQRDVLSLYRQCLRVARKKPAETRKHFEQFARSATATPYLRTSRSIRPENHLRNPGISPSVTHVNFFKCFNRGEGCFDGHQSTYEHVRWRNAKLEFEKNLSIEKRDFGAIEYMLRKGHRQLEIYEDPGITDIHR